MNELFCAYLRKSRKDMEAEARGEGETLTRHEHILLELSRQLHIPLHKIYREIVSGETISARPVMQQLLREVEAGMWKGVFVVEIERLARGDTRDQGYVAEAFTYSDTKIITPMKIYDPSDPSDQEYFEFSLFMSRREYKVINRRLESGRRQSFLEGKFLGNVPPYGWERYRLSGQKGYSLRPNPSESRCLQMIYDLAAYGLNGTPMGPDLIAARLNRLGIPSRSGSRWNGSTVRGIIQNEHNIGLVRRGRRKTVKKLQSGQILKSRPCQKAYELAEGLHHGLISSELFEQANRNIQTGRSCTILRRSLKNPLAGLVFCSCCGRSMLRRPAGPKAKYDFLYCPTPGCKTIGSPLKLVEDSVIAMLTDWTAAYILQPPTVSHAANARLSSHLSRLLEEKKTELLSVKKQRGSLHDLLEKGIYSPDIFLERQHELALREQQLCASIKETEYTLLSHTPKFPANSIADPGPVIEYYSALEPDEQNHMLKLLLSRIVYRKTERSKKGEGTSPQFTLDIWPNIPGSVL